MQKRLFHFPPLPLRLLASVKQAAELFIIGNKVFIMFKTTDNMSSTEDSQFYYK